MLNINAYVGRGALDFVPDLGDEVLDREGVLGIIAESVDWGGCLFQGRLETLEPIIKVSREVTYINTHYMPVKAKSSLSKPLTFLEGNNLGYL